MSVLERGIFFLGFYQTAKQLQGTFVLFDLGGFEDFQCDFFPVEIIKETEKGNRFSDNWPISFGFFFFNEFHLTFGRKLLI